MDFLIDLQRWGITKGIPTKPYQDADYIQADLNIQGINNAIQYAQAEGYSSVTLPAGEYAVCYPRPIQMANGIKFNHHFCFTKVIYDSDRKSPFDNRTGTDYYNFGGVTISFAKAEHAKFVGGEIEGCRADRSFANPLEVAYEHSYGIQISQGAVFNVVEDCKVHDYMGDNISFQSSGYIPYTEFDEGCTVESLDYKTGQPVAVTSPKTLITKYLPIQFEPGKKTEFMFVGGAGYSRLTNLVNKYFDTFFYDKDNKFLGVHKKRRIYSDIEIPPGATKYRFQFLDESIVKQHGLCVWFGRIPSQNIIRNCEIYNGHRGGVTLGGSRNIVENNVIRANGKGLANFLDGKPIFNDPTRYAINMEDSYGSKCVIRDNDIYDCFHGILVGCLDVEILNNQIHDTDFYAINLYSVQHVKIVGNSLYNNMNNLGMQDSQIFCPYVLVEGNSFDKGTLNFTQTATHRVDIRNNQFINPTSVFLNNNCNMSDCHFVYTENVNATSITANRLKNCSFKSSQLIILRELIIKSYEYTDCVFENLRVRFESPNNKVLSKAKITGASFKGCEIRNHIFNPYPINAEISDSTLVDTIVEVGITNVDGQAPYTRLYNCDITIVSSGIKYLFTSDCTRPYTTYTAENCRITISNAGFIAMLNSGTALQSNHLRLLSNQITYTGTTPLALKFYTNVNHIKDFTEAGNTYTNVTLPA